MSLVSEILHPNVIDGVLGSLATIWIVGVFHGLTTRKFGSSSVEEMLDLPPDPIEDSLLGIMLGLLVLLILVAGAILFSVANESRRLGAIVALVALSAKRLGMLSMFSYFRNVYRTTCKVAVGLVWWSFRGFIDLVT